MGLTGRWCQFELGRFANDEFTGGTHNVAGNPHSVTGDVGSQLFYPAGARPERNAPGQQEAGPNAPNQVGNPAGRGNPEA
jgi:hypothetical protein